MLFAVFKKQTHGKKSDEDDGCWTWTQVGVAGVVGGLSAVGAVAVGLPALGFTSVGIAAGSLAAGAQSLGKLALADNCIRNTFLITYCFTFPAATTGVGMAPISALQSLGAVGVGVGTAVKAGVASAAVAAGISSATCDKKSGKSCD